MSQHTASSEHCLTYITWPRNLSLHLDFDDPRILFPVLLGFFIWSTVVASFEIELGPSSGCIEAF